MEDIKLYNENCLETMGRMKDNSIDSIVTDPPYGLSFMGKKWDYDVPSVAIWKECLRVLKSGGYLLSFAGTRTQHRMAVNIEDAGFEIRDMISWVYGSGFPKSMDVSKAIDKNKGNYVKGKISPNSRNSGESPSGCYGEGVQSKHLSNPQSDEAKQWEGWRTALKPALEPIVVARKPLSEKTVASNVLKHGTGGINIDGCRIGTDDKLKPGGSRQRPCIGDERVGKALGMFQPGTIIKYKQSEKGRFPANLIHDGSDEVISLFPNTKSGSLTANQQKNGGFKGAVNCYGSAKQGGSNEYESNEGSASRFFYCAKASKSERNLGLEHFEDKKIPYSEYRKNFDNTHSYVTEYPDGSRRPMNKSKNNHPTVKPIALMEYLCRLVTPPNGTVLDPFMGSGSTGCGAISEGFNFVGIEMDEYFCEISKARIKHFFEIIEEDNKIKPLSNFW